MTLHEKLEEKLATFKGAEACITFQSGFSANIGAIPALVGRGDVIFSDALNHASIIDGCRLSRAEIVRYEHNDVEDLRRQIEATTDYNRRLIVTDGVFSMDGDIAPLDQIAGVAEEYGIMLMVDDAHAKECWAKAGVALSITSGCTAGLISRSVPLSKAFGVVGGMVAGKQLIVDWLRQRAAPSSSPAP
jgi:glycine C-acetyltransferase